MTQADAPGVPFHRPTVVGTELGYVAKALEEQHLAGDGCFTDRCQGLLEEELGATRVLLTTSCTHALEMTALLLDVQPGDEVILPSFTFVSTANAFVLRGARPVFIDIRPDTLNLDETLLADRIGPRTRAVAVVHYGGIGAEMTSIQSTAEARGVEVVEDNAHGLFGRYRDRWLGTWSRLSTLSFHNTKNFTCGEGGALVINDPDLVPRAEILREKGTDRSRFIRGEVDKYTWVDVGSSYLPSELLAAFLYGQLEARHRVQRDRRRIWNAYVDGLGDWAGSRGVKLPTVPDTCDPAAHLFYLLLPDAASRDRLIAHLSHRGVQATFHYLPLHLSEMGRRFGGRPGDHPVTESICGRLLRLPFFTSLGESEQNRVLEAVHSFTP